MARQLTLAQRIFCCKEIHKGTPYNNIVQLWMIQYPADAPPSRKCLYKLKKKFDEHGTVQNRHRDGSGRPKSGVNVEHALMVFESVADHPKLGTRRRSAMLDIPRTTLRRILVGELHYFPYHITKRHALQPQDLTARIRVGDWFLAKDLADDDFLENVWWSDEANFNLRGSVNSQNAVHWGSERPDEVQQVPLHSPKLVVWCALSSHGVIGPYFFRDQNGATTTVTSVRYLEMLKRYYVPELFNFCTAKDLDPFAMHFQQDGARAHITMPVQNFLRGTFGTRTIGENLGEHWPARSPDLTPCDFFLWGWLKDEVYKRMPFADLNALEAAIRDVIRTMPTDFCHRACTTVTKRFDIMKNRGGGHIEHLL